MCLIWQESPPCSEFVESPYFGDQGLPICFSGGVHNSRSICSHYGMQCHGLRQRGQGQVLTQVPKRRELPGTQGLACPSYVMVVFKEFALD